ncbi:MAG: hypothetical protein CMJ78_25755 [Planctomycetaceae bacterium]|nr:hypothetical protein [Planctomycetaceae bacterium]
MTEHEFTIILDQPEESEDDANRLYEAGCGDGSISTSGGVTRIDFHRRAANLESAIRSAVSNVQSAGFSVAHVLIEPESLGQAS